MMVSKKLLRRGFALWIILMLILLAVAIANPVHAQGETPYIIRSTKPMSNELKEYLNAWLAIDAPSDAPYYIVTYWKVRGSQTMVSLVGVDLDTPDANWTFENGAAWIGSVTVSASGDVFPFSADPQAHAGGVLAIPSLAPGGGSYVAFPFASGTAALYGPRGVHGEGEYSTSGMVAIDLVGGDNMGASAMPPYVYASDTGTVDWVCDDGVSVAVRTYNDETEDYFLYAHMLDNTNLEMDHSFSQGEKLGSLKYGSFNPPDPDCGWADQAANHYHVHWMFTPENNHFQVGSCVITISTQVWQCADQIIKTGGSLVGGAGVDSSSGAAGAHGGSGGTTGRSDGGVGAVLRIPTFWDYILTGIFAIFDKGIIKLLPSHQPFAYTYMLFNVIEIVLRLSWVLVESNINLRPLFTVILVGISTNLIFGAVWLVSYVFKLVKSLAPFF